MHWSPDGTQILYWWGEPVRYSTIDLATRQKRDVIRHPKYNIHNAQYSPDGRWLSFNIPKETGISSVFIAPLHDGVARPESEWIVVSDGSASDPKAWWSPDGNLLYFFSNRDGFICLWAQRLDAQTHRPAGVAFAVLHFHQARHPIHDAVFGPAILRGRMIFSLLETTGNIWMAKLE
jgi:Tol biopolymer transport system component